MDDYRFCNWHVDTSSVQYQTFKEAVTGINGRWYETQTFAEASLFIYSIAGEMFTEFADALKVVYRSKNEIHLSFVPHFDVNAYAFCHNDMRFIGLYFGLACRLMDIANALFSCSDFAPEIGDAQKVGLSVDQVREAVTRRYSMRDFAGWTAIRGPKCPVRSEAAFAICMYSSFFVIAHEFAHVYMNHLDGADRSDKGLRTLLELTDNKPEPDKIAARRQVQEYQADRFALSAIFHLLSPDHRVLTVDELKNIKLGMAIFYRILDLYVKPSALHFKGSHPLPGIRSVLMESHAVKLFSSYNKFAVDEFSRSWILADLMVQDIWDAMGLGGQGSFGLDMDLLHGEAVRVVELWAGQVNNEISDKSETASEEVEGEAAGAGAGSEGVSSNVLPFRRPEGRRSN